MKDKTQDNKPIIDIEHIIIEHFDCQGEKVVAKTIENEVELEEGLLSNATVDTRAGNRNYRKGDQES